MTSYPIDHIVVDPVNGPFAEALREFDAIFGTAPLAPAQDTAIEESFADGAA